MPAVQYSKGSGEEVRTYREKLVKYTTQELVEVQCELCPAMAKGVSWKSSTWQVQDVELEIKVHQKEGQAFPEGGCGTEYTVDLCPDCFKNKLVPWLISQGADVKPIEWDW